MNRAQATRVVFDARPLRVADVDAIARGHVGIWLSDDAGFARRIDSGAEFLRRLLLEDGVIYGVTTGYGDSCGTSIPTDLVSDLPQHLYTFHGCGLGEPFSVAETRAVLVARLASLCQGYSGVRYELLQHLARLLQLDIMPVMPSEGSVGASGDLTPLSYLAAVLEGRRRVWHEGQQQETQSVFSQQQLQPLTLQPKEGLAIMNGTAVMTGVACMALGRAEYLARLATRLTSLGVIALQGNALHYDPALFAVKPHPGQSRVANWIHNDLPAHDTPRNSPRVQDRYSLRCAPHVIGVLVDALSSLGEMVEIELNSANDNPIIDPESERVLHGGHFYGGHIAFAMDSLKNAVANVADLVDRQVAQLMDPKFNHGLPANLSGAPAQRQAVNHGFKALQIACSAWTAEALKATMPASVFSRSTECHNQDKVSMGTIAARDCQRVLTLTEQVLAAGILVTWQAVQLRLRSGELQRGELPAQVCGNLDHTATLFEFLAEDRELDTTLKGVLDAIAGRQWALYD